MGFIFGFLALLLAFIAYQASERSTRIFFVCCCLLNTVAFITVVARHDPYAWRLRPNPCDSKPESQACADVTEPAYRP
jgi:hypothetical protein